MKKIATRRKTPRAEQTTVAEDNAKQFRLWVDEAALLVLDELDMGMRAPAFREAVNNALTLTTLSITNMDRQELLSFRLYFKSFALEYRDNKQQSDSVLTRYFDLHQDENMTSKPFATEDQAAAAEIARLNTLRDKLVADLDDANRKLESAAATLAANKTVIDGLAKDRKALEDHIASLEKSWPGGGSSQPVGGDVELARSQVVINNFPITVVTYRDMSTEDAASAVLKHVELMTHLVNADKVVRFGVVSPATPVYFVKGGENKPPAKPDDHATKDAPPKEQPKKSGFGSSKPADDKPKSSGDGDGDEVEGEMKEQETIKITRKNVDGENQYKLAYLWNGQPSQFPMDITNKRAVKTLEKALEDYGWGEDDLPTKTEKPLRMMVRWEVGPEYGKTASGKAKHYKNNMTFTILD